MATKYSILVFFFFFFFSNFFLGTSANDLHFQAYLLEGLARWNTDRHQAALSESTGGPTYNPLLSAAVNDLSSKVLKEKLAPRFTAPREYTGELIGVEYLYSQTGQVLQDMARETEEEKAEAGKEEFDEDEDEGFQEMDPDSDQTTGQDPAVVSPASNTGGEQQPQSATSIPLDPPSTPEKQPPSPDNISPTSNTGSPSSSDVNTKNVLGIYNMYSSVYLIYSYSRSLLDLIMLRTMDVWSSLPSSLSLTNQS